MEVEDDVFFADLNRQISLLIMEDDDGGVPVVAHYPSVSPQVFCRANHQYANPSYSYHENSRRETRGTGVFIPQSSRPRRKNKQSSGKHKASEKNSTTRGHPQAAFSSHDSFNPKR